MESGLQKDFPTEEAEVAARQSLKPTQDIQARSANGNLKERLCKEIVQFLQSVDEQEHNLEPKKLLEKLQQFYDGEVDE